MTPDVLYPGGESQPNSPASDEAAQRTEKPVILICLSGGGFTSETKSLLAALNGDFAFTYLKAPWGGDPGQPDFPMGTSHEIPAFANNVRPSIRKSAWAFIVTFLAACRVLSRNRVDLVVGVGSSHVPPMLLAGRLFRKQTVFIESFTRVDKLSRTGALVYHLGLARAFIVQWPALQKLYPRSRLGTLL